MIRASRVPGAFTPLVALLGVLRLSASTLTVQDLRCEYLNNPLGIDVPQPRLSWALESDSKSARGERQTAYEVLVAGSRQKLAANQGDLWDTGRVDSDQSIQLGYAGKPLVSQQECFWKVRVWDQSGHPSGWSAPAQWSMGLLSPTDWQAYWIGVDGVELQSTLTNTSWIWFPEGHPEESAPVGTRYFRRSFVLPPGRIVKSARWLVSGDNEFAAFVNGKMVGLGNNFKTAAALDVARELRSGRNFLAATVRNSGDAPNPAGFVGLLRVEFWIGGLLVLATDENWLTSAEELSGWLNQDYDDSTWLPARNLGPVGMEPWGEVSGPEDRRLPARWLRKEFAIEKKVRRATAYFSGLGLSELYLNGRRVSDEALSPGLTEYSKRTFYVTRDVTSQLKRGRNALGVVLGNGRFFAPRSKAPTDTRSFGFPKLIFQMRVEYQDGSTAMVVSDESWKVTTEGPIRANNEYDGEEYDARLEMPGWSEPGFDDSKWQPAQLVGSGSGTPAQSLVATDIAKTGPLFMCANLAAQMIEPIRVTQTLAPVALTQPKPGVYVFDMGQNMVGWCRLHVSGPRGTVVSLRHAETIKPDGTLYVANLRGAKVTDTYTLKGQGREVYEPRLTYHGFRYVELNGYPGKPSLSTLEGRVVHDDLESAGGFVCADLLVNRIYDNIRWGVLGNYRSIPTDCPQRDERQGWLGDRSAESKGETYLFNTAALYSKWLQDMADAQKDTGSVPDVCPAYWPIYSDNVTWPSSTVIIPKALSDQYGDSGVVAGHYDSAKRWMDYMEGFVTNGIIERDSYGDWCVPPEDPALIHSNDPKRKTDKALLATAYFYEDARLMAGYATHLRKSDEAQHFTQLAETLKAAFNDRFLNAQDGQYDNGSQTSCVLPLAFDLAPEAERERILQHLLAKIENESKGHIGTGLIGGQWLMRALSDNGRPDVAYQIASQHTYPSWGYMVEKGATTIWELWNGDTADPAMNSGNHVMLVGDLGIWLFENLAGIKPDPAQPGFKHIVMRPEPVGNLRFVRATHHSPYGLIASEWKKDPKRFRWNIVVPLNTTATVYVPARSAEAVKESGRPASRARGVKFLSMENGRAVFEVGSGHYRFESDS
ncbi:MAG TPA: family 78 glycoside hydrolase catalytic domain [Candidatus Acidoferrum sp.]|jgi:alpha-L-rhamnosidase|nr:family 78 glycoside hydrolase catalytic domain [Candidatus Acidoferrum sp.]